MAQEITLQATCPATRIPAGDAVELPAGGTYHLAQALGGSVTLRDATGLYRIAREHLAALGPEVAAAVGAADDDRSGADDDGPLSEEKLWAALRQCFDPEIPVNIVDLGLIYDLRSEPREDGRHDVDVRMTLTATGCGMGPTIAADARSRLEALPQVAAANVEIVWDPQWTPHMISPEGRKILGLD